MKLITKYEYDRLKENYIFWHTVIRKLTFNKVQLADVDDLMKDYVVVNI